MTELSQEKVNAIERQLAKARTAFAEWVQRGIGSVSMVPWVRVFIHTAPHISERNLSSYLQQRASAPSERWWVGWFGVGVDADLWVCFTPPTGHGMLAQARCERRQVEDIVKLLDLGLDEDGDPLTDAQRRELQAQRTLLDESSSTLFDWAWYLIKASPRKTEEAGA